MKTAQNNKPLSSRGQQYNLGNGFTLQPVDIGHAEYVGLVDPDTAFWALVRKDQVGKALTDGLLLKEYRHKASRFTKEMQTLRFGLKPSAVYFNLTERCNLDCRYCYIPRNMRRRGVHMAKTDLIAALGKLKQYFRKTLPAGVKPQIVFHGAEPTLNREALFAALTRFQHDFRFGIQTNGTMLDSEDIRFLTERGIAIGLSLDGPAELITGRTRKTWAGRGVHSKVVETMEKLRGYSNYSVICTVTRHNLNHLVETVEFFHEYKVPTCLLNPVRCTRTGARRIKPSDEIMSRYYFQALERTCELYRTSGRKLVVANFANILLAILAPQARRLMCDISPCGGGRCFFAVSARGDLFPCSEFIGLPSFKGGNLFKDNIEQVLRTPPFHQVTVRKVEDIEPCCRCALRHFCGSPCPAEAWEMNGAMERPGAFCELYAEQALYALRLIADGRHHAYLWDNWDKATVTSFDVSMP